MIETLTNIQWFAISIAALSIGMSKPVFKLLCS